MVWELDIAAKRTVKKTPRRLNVFWMGLLLARERGLNHALSVFERALQEQWFDR